ncbi:MAG: tetratricopeptide repeat protein [Gemmatimonadaceae bacterium]|nr:tetratricopeptide repeat protein [Gemmatimonadaceae bacterium]
MSRLDAFRAMVAKNPANMQARFGLANEAVKAGALEEALEHYMAYLAGFDDEGNGYARLADVLEQLGRGDELREALVRGVAAAERHGHPSMAAELQDRLDEFGP